jgi:hypothetical protein
MSSFLTLQIDQERGGTYRHSGQLGTCIVPTDVVTVIVNPVTLSDHVSIDMQP